MKPQTTQEACKRFCPFTFDGGSGASTCVTNHCMAWRVVHPEVRREDHSGNRERVVQWGQETTRVPRREGGPMSSGLWVLDEVGVCSRLER